MYRKEGISPQEWRRQRRHGLRLAALTPIFIAAGCADTKQASPPATQAPSSTPPEQQEAKKGREYPIHRNVKTTFFWIGEGVSDVSTMDNADTAWDSQALEHYGGVDSWEPEKRDGDHPKAFTPKENPYYFALPYNDFDANGKRRQEAADVIPWAKDREWADNESMLKNRWIKVTNPVTNEVCYGQWQDSGPFKTPEGEMDPDYVFGDAKPKNDTSGLDISPAMRDCLKFAAEQGVAQMDWQFVDEVDVPDGPWKEIVTKRQVSWQ